MGHVLGHQSLRRTTKADLHIHTEHSASSFVIFGPADLILIVSLRFTDQRILHLMRLLLAITRRRVHGIFYRSTLFEHCSIGDLNVVLLAHLYLKPFSFLKLRLFLNLAKLLVRAKNVRARIRASLITLLRANLCDLVRCWDLLDFVIGSFERIFHEIFRFLEF